MKRISAPSRKVPRPKNTAPAAKAATLAEARTTSTARAGGTLLPIVAASAVAITPMMTAGPSCTCATTPG